MTGNLPADFPPDSFALIAFCETCGHQTTLERDRLPPVVTVQDPPDRGLSDRFEDTAGPGLGRVEGLSSLNAAATKSELR